ncbi:MAG: hypothetical protein M3N46_02045 [Actinomycetota bacterium]|nr:hypothetical protein [Actinomycetota bacterium]
MTPRYGVGTQSEECLAVTMPGLTRRRPQLDAAGAALEEFFGALPSGRTELLAWVVRHPRQVARAARTIRALPLLRVTPSQTPDGRVLSAGLARQSVLARRLVAGTTSVVLISDDPDAYSAGYRRKTLRKQRNDAVRDGVHWVRVDDHAERALLLERANAGERAHPDSRYRTQDPDNSDLLPLSGWWVALSGDETPLLLAVAAIDGRWAMLRYFRVLERTQDGFRARFLMMDVLVRELAALGVRVLATDMSPIRLTPGLRDFQHRVGFELVRVRTGRGRG